VSSWVEIEILSNPDSHGPGGRHPNPAQGLIGGSRLILDVLMEIYAITGLAGAIGTFLPKRGEETKDKH
jgi:hypothetical protein